jgi:hypothetical protein
MRRAIDIMRAESAGSAAQIEHKLKHEGFEAAGQFAAYAVQCDVLQLKPWEAPPSSIWGNFCSGGIELRDRLVAAGLSVYEPDPARALAKTERAKVQTAKCQGPKDRRAGRRARWANPARHPDRSALPSFARPGQTLSNLNRLRADIPPVNASSPN